MSRKKESALGSYFYRGGRKIELEKLPDRFTVRLKTACPGADAGARTYDCAMDREIPRQALAEFSVDAARRDDVMEKVRKDNRVAFASHVYRARNDPASRIYLTNEITVRFKDTATDEDIEAVAREHGLQLVKSIPGLPNTYVFRLTEQARENPIKIANRLMDDPRVDLCEPNVIVESHAYYLPADPLFREQWHLHHSGGPFLSANSHIDAARAWDLTRGERSVVVAVADDSVDLNHVDFQGPGKIVAPRDFSGRDFDPAPELPSDNHGTACAGVAVAEENGTGVVGVAPGCALMPIRTSGFLDDNSIEELFDWVIEHGASVVSCSWGAAAINFPLSLRQSHAIHRAATQGRDGKGCVIVFAAGNANRPVNGEVDEKGWPNNLLSGPTQWLAGFAAHEDVIAVSACTSLGKKAAYSNWGREISVCAPSSNGHPGMFFPGIGPMPTYPRIESDFPGRGVVTTDRVGPAGYSSADYTRDFGGTSSATPAVAGVAALVLSANPGLTAREVKAILERTADKIEDDAVDPQLGHAYGTYDENGHSLWFGYGKVNAYKAVAEALRLKNQNDGGVIARRSMPKARIPDNDPAGVHDAIDITEPGLLATVRVQVAIRHTYIGDLRVTLRTPGGREVVLHNRNGGARDNLETVYDSSTTTGLAALVGEPVQGRWELAVQDLAALDEGILEEWGLECRLQRRDVYELTDQEGLAIPDNDPRGVSRTLVANAAGRIRDIQVSVDITHSYIGDLSVRLRSPAGEEVVLHHREGGTQDNLIRTYKPADIPGLQRLIGAPVKGPWELHVADLARLDRGKLNRWGLRFLLEPAT